MGNVYAYLITKVEIDKPEMLDISGYEHPYWPGEVILTPENLGATPEPQRYQMDSVLGFDVTLHRVAIGTKGSVDGPIIFDEPARILLNLIKLGAQREAGLAELLHGVLDTAKATIESKSRGHDALGITVVYDILDTVEREATTVKRRT